MRANEQVKTLCALGEPYTSYTEGFDDAKDYCLQIAAGADALIDEMAEALRALQDYGNQRHIDRRAAWAMDKADAALKHYQEYVK